MDPRSGTMPPLWRRLFHVVAGSAIPCIAIPLTGGIMVVLMSVLSGLALVVEVARFQFPALNRQLVMWLKPLLKATEDHRITGATYIALGALAAFLLFDKSIAVTALLFLSLGDPAAALVGSRARGIRLFGKSPWGTVAFALVALGVAGVLSMTGVVSAHWALAVGALVAGLVELTPLPMDDNFTIPLIAGGVMSGLVGI